MNISRRLGIALAVALAMMPACATLLQAATVAECRAKCESVKQQCINCVTSFYYNERSSMHEVKEVEACEKVHGYTSGVSSNDCEVDGQACKKKCN